MACARVVLVLGTVALATALIPNLHSGCLKCLCEAATGCNRTLECYKGYCGPFKVSRVYWSDAGKPVMTEDDPERDGAYQDCARQYYCAQNIVKGYMARFGKDCNGDGVVNCDDYAMIHYNGAYSCEKSIDDNDHGKRYFKCRPPRDESHSLLRSVSSS